MFITKHVGVGWYGPCSCQREARSVCIANVLFNFSFLIGWIQSFVIMNACHDSGSESVGQVYLLVVVVQNIEYIIENTYVYL